MRRAENLFLNTVDKRVPDLCKAGVYTSFKTWGNEWAWSVSAVCKKKNEEKNRHHFKLLVNYNVHLQIMASTK